MKFRYLGDPNQPSESKNLPEEFNAFGVTFTRNKFVEVPDDVVPKLVSNGHFKAQNESEAESLVNDEPTAETQAAISQLQEEAADKARAEAEADFAERLARFQQEAADTLAAERDRADAAEQLLAEQSSDEAPAKRGPGRPKAS